MADLGMYSPVTVFLLLLVHRSHVFVVDLAARSQVRLRVGEELVGAEVDDVEAADIGVVGPVPLPDLVVGRHVAVPPHQLVEHGGHRLRSHLRYVWWVRSTPSRNQPTEESIGRSTKLDSSRTSPPP